jgi:hypothetical protein
MERKNVAFRHVAQRRVAMVCAVRGFAPVFFLSPGANLGIHLHGNSHEGVIVGAVRSFFGKIQVEPLRVLG